MKLERNYARKLVLAASSQWKLKSDYSAVYLYVGHRSR